MKALIMALRMTHFLSKKHPDSWSYAHLTRSSSFSKCRKIEKKKLSEHLRTFVTLWKLNLNDSSWFQWLKATFDSMPERIEDVIEAKGGHTKW